MSELLDIELLRQWEEYFGLEPCETQEVDSSMVTCDYAIRYELLGYCFADNTLYFECEVTEAAIVHECIHRIFPSWKGFIGEFLVRQATKFVLWRTGNYGK